MAAPGKVFFPHLCALLAACCSGFALGQEDSSRELTCMQEFEPAPAGYRFVGRERPQYDIPEDARIDDIHYTRLPIFNESDPDEDNLLFRWANRVHIMTREDVVAQQVLFESGQSYRERILAESARLLRDQDYFYDVDVRPVSLCGDEVDVEVITRDTWSFTPSVDFDRSGGENTYSFNLRDSNILGFGKLLSIAREHKTDRDSSELIYNDPNVFGSRVTARFQLTNSDDGFNRSFDFGLPFFSLDTQRAWGVHLTRERRDDKQYFRGDEISEVEHRIDDLLVEFGISDGLREGVVRRWNFGYRYREDAYAPGHELPPPADFPGDTELSFPFISYEMIEDEYTTAFNLDQIYRTEDLHLGRQLFARLGVAARAFGSDNSRLVGTGGYRNTLVYTGDMLWRHSLEWEGRWNMDSTRAEDVLISYSTSYFRRQTAERSFFASFDAVYAKNLDGVEQVVLGGLTGARAYDNRFQTGDRRLHLSLEERLYSDLHLLNLFRVGGAVFLDVGRAWEPGVADGTEDELLADIGFGLRLASSKAAAGRVAHLDVAFPMTNRDDPEVGSYQIAFTIKSAF